MRAEQREHQEQHAKHGESGTEFFGWGFVCVDPFEAENRWKSQDMDGQTAKRLGVLASSQQCICSKILKTKRLGSDDFSICFLFKTVDF